MVGLGKVDEFEVKAEGAGKAIRGGEVKGPYAGDGLLKMCSGGGGIRLDSGVGLATGDGGAAKGLDGFIQIIAGLFPQNVAQQRTQRANIAAERGFFQVRRAGLKLSKAVGPVGGGPK